MFCSIKVSSGFRAGSKCNFMLKLSFSCNGGSVRNFRIDMSKEEKTQKERRRRGINVYPRKGSAILQLYL